MENWQKVFEARLNHQAKIVRDVLIAKQIPAVVMNKKDSMYHIGGFEVMVHPDNALKASMIITNDIQFEE